ncbi:three-Cys-motif partner protein TcmP [Bradyrhizobium sp.]|uniref:three-Cys-motif partner protein TcmP n=1 Tax=Bradyrhizobium sp. TaxID=376 RepID=UPI00273380BC|nr:three-Cys-motif partner protein TcmP [Bradyrhizobium sp.]MDP3076355.1 three-Cys-motif partner protein TcmP [Bradyrhizobium sp.]
MANTPPFKFDKVGIWSELKLEIVEKYGSAYTRAFANQPRLKKFYVDAFSGAGVHISKRSGGQIHGSPARALNTSPPFDEFVFIDMDAQKTAHLKALCAGRSNVQIETGDASEYLIHTLLPTIKYENYKRALCLFDPYGLHLEWRAMEMAGQSRAIDMFLNFPVMDMNRNAIWRNPRAVPQDGIDRMNSFWGDESWREAAYSEHPQGNLFGAPDIVKQGNDAIVSAFRERLRKVAGFQFVAEPLPMKNSTNAVVYYLFFASQKLVAQKIIDGIFEKYR